MLQKQAIRVEENDGKSTDGEIEIETYDPKTRTERTVKTLGACLLAAFAAVFIPVLHLFLVPALLITAIFLPGVIYQQVGVVRGGTAVCPHCQKSFTPVKSTLKWPIKDTCPACYTSLSFTKRA